MALELKCQACVDVERGEQKILPYSLGTKASPWQLVALDTFEMVFPAARRKCRFLLMADVAMKFVSVSFLWAGQVGDAGTDSGRRIIEAFTEGWLLHRPKPQWIIVDPQTSMASGDFTQFCQHAGIGMTVTPGEAHWQNGHIESLIRVIKNTMKKIRNDEPLLDPRVVANLAVVAHNNLARVKGFSPVQWAYGTDFKNDYEADPLAVNSQYERVPHQFWETHKHRELAETRWKEVQAQEAMTRLKNAAPRATRTFHVGEWVCIWRTAIWRSRKGSQNPEPRFVGPGRVALVEPSIHKGNQSAVYWVLLGNQVWRCAPEQMRKASALEITLEEAVNNQRFATPITELMRQCSKVFDVVREGPYPIDDLNLPERPHSGRMPSISDEHSRAQSSLSWQQDVGSMDDRWARRRRAREAAGSEVRQETTKERTVRWQQLISLNENRRLEGLPPVMELPPLPPDERLNSVTVEHYALDGEHDAPMTLATYEAVMQRIAELEEEVKFRDERALLLKEIEQQKIEELHFKEMLGQACDTGGEVCQMVVDIDDWQSFCRNQTLYTKQAIQETKEISWKTLTPQHKELVMEAMARELNEVIVSQALRRLHEHVPEEDWKQRCIPMRWLLTWKPLDEYKDPSKEPQPGVIRDDGYAKAKARLILIGYKHPDLAKRDPRTGKPLLQTSSPTLSRLGRNLLLQAGALDGHTLECGDAKSAFLQADEGIGTDELYTSGVAEIKHALGVGQREALKVVGAIYGLTNAPRIFWKDVDAKLQKIGFQPHAIDKCVWTYRSVSNGNIIGRVGSHVDDFLLFGDHNNPEYMSVRAKVFDMYQWSPWKRGQFIFAGVHLQQLQDHSIVMSQEHFCNQLQPVKIDNERLRPKDDALTPKEVSQARGLIMQAQWRAIQTAPQYCARIGLASSSLRDANLSHLREANAIVKELRKSSKDNLIFHSFQGEDRHWQHMVFLHFGDAAQRNRPDGSDTGGYITGITTSRILEGKETRMSILDYRSFKLERPARGSNGAESQAIYEAEDKGWKARVFWSLLYGEKLTRSNGDELASQVESLLVMDSRGCFDALNSESPLLGMNNAKTGVDMLSVKRGVRDGTNCYLTWVPSDLNIADCMTKVSADAFKVFMLWQQRKTWIVRFEEEFVSARKQQKLRRQKLLESKAAYCQLDLWPEEHLDFHDGSNPWPQRD